MAAGLAWGLVGVLAACTTDTGDPQSTPPAAAPSATDTASLVVQPRESEDSDEQVDVGGVLIDVPAGLEVRPTSDGVTEKVGLHAPGRDRAVLVLSVTEDEDGVTDAEVDTSREVFEHQLRAAGLAEDVTRTGVEWSPLAYAVGLQLELLVDDQELPLTWVVGRDEAGSRLVTVYVEADPGEDLESTPGYDAFRTLRLG